ncbi:hypothetical protein NUSPORA_01423 [Nucleospora cyclopteri]
MRTRSKTKKNKRHLRINPVIEAIMDIHKSSPISSNKNQKIKNKKRCKISRRLINKTESVVNINVIDTKLKITSKNKKNSKNSNSKKNNNEKKNNKKNNNEKKGLFNIFFN